MPSESLHFKVIGTTRCPYCQASMSLGVIKGTNEPAIVHEGVACESFNTGSLQKTFVDLLKSTDPKRTN